MHLWAGLLVLILWLGSTWKARNGLTWAGGMAGVCASWWLLAVPLFLQPPHTCLYLFAPSLMQCTGDFSHRLTCTMLAVVLVTQLCPILCDPTDCTLPGSSVYGILQARILEWIAIPFSRGSFPPRDWTQVSCITGRLFTIWATGKKGEYRNFFRRGMLRCQKWGFYPGGLSCVPSFILSRWWRLGVLNFVRETPAITC